MHIFETSMTTEEVAAGGQSSMDTEFAHAKLFLNTDKRVAMSFSLMSFLRRAKQSSPTHVSAEGRLQNCTHGRLSYVMIETHARQSEDDSGLVSLQQKQDRVEEWLMNTVQYPDAGGKCRQH